MRSLVERREAQVHQQRQAADDGHGEEEAEKTGVDETADLALRGRDERREVSDGPARRGAVTIEDGRARAASAFAGAHAFLASI
jgi:hypothetical protein